MKRQARIVDELASSREVGQRQHLAVLGVLERKQSGARKWVVFGFDLRTDEVEIEGRRERVLSEHPAVAASAVFGLPDPRLGERVVAVVECETGAAATADGLTEHVRRELARYKAPEEFRFVDEMPRNAMGKILKRRLEPLFD